MTMLTEEEAKTKWCPHAVASHTNPRAGFDDPSYPKVFACIGSACMAWRWGDTPREQMRNYHDAPTVGHRHEGGLGRVYEGGWQYHLTDIDHDGRKFDILHRRPTDDAPKHGYCGIAGKVGA